MNEQNQGIIEICADYYGWPDTWQIGQRDIQHGSDLINTFEPFIEEMIAKLNPYQRGQSKDIWAICGSSEEKSYEEST